MQEQEIAEQPAGMAELMARLDKLVVALSVKSAPALWNAEQIGEWIGLSEYTVKQKVVCQEGFPAPVKATGLKDCSRRWFADEVIDWARKHRGALPAARPGRRRNAA